MSFPYSTARPPESLVPVFTVLGLYIFTTVDDNFNTSSCNQKLHEPEHLCFVNFYFCMGGNVKQCPFQWIKSACQAIHCSFLWKWPQVRYMTHNVYLKWFTWLWKNIRMYTATERKQKTYSYHSSATNYPCDIFLASNFFSLGLWPKSTER